MTTKRYTLEDVWSFHKSPDWQVLQFSLKDKFGDNGIIGVAILAFSGEVCEIDTFLISCRVLERQVETAALNHMVSLCKDKGIKKLKARYIKTQKNAVCALVYPDYGFQEDKDTFSLQIDSFSVKDISELFRRI
jgi:FkbH-like protein